MIVAWRLCREAPRPLGGILSRSLGRGGRSLSRSLRRSGDVCDIYNGNNNERNSTYGLPPRIFDGFRLAEQSSVCKGRPWCVGMSNPPTDDVGGLFVCL